MPATASKISAFLFPQPQIESPAAHTGLLLLRIYAGLTATFAGLDKLPMPDWMIDQVITVGFPFPTFFAWLACFVEFACGILIVLGFMTRLSAGLLAITFGVAAFGFHGVLPFLHMHIAQHFFWMYILLACTGAGTFSLDHLMTREPSFFNRQRFVIAGSTIVGLLLIGILIEQRKPVYVATETEPEISSINIPGSFNNWDPSANTMRVVNESEYTLEQRFDGPGLIEFKFTVNASWDINLGANSRSDRFPLDGIAAIDEGNTTENFRSYIPAAGTYQFTFNSDTYAFRLDSLNTTQAP